VVQWIDDESTTVSEVNDRGRSDGIQRWQCDLHETSCQEDDGIDDSHDPFVSPFAVNPKFLGEGQVGPVGSSLIPSLCGGSDGTQRDGIPKHERAVPFVVPLVLERMALLFFKRSNCLDVFGVTGDESGPTEQSGVLSHVMRLGPSPGIDDGLLLGAALWE